MISKTTPSSRLYHPQIRDLLILLGVDKSHDLKKYYPPISKPRTPPYKYHGSRPMLGSALYFLPLVILSIASFISSRKKPGALDSNMSPEADTIIRFLEGSSNDDLPPSVLELRESTKLKARASMAILSQAISNYGIENVSISFNGGKDCLVMLYLYMAVLEQNKIQLNEEKIKSVYIYYEKTFDQISEFNTKIVQKCRLDLKTYSYCKLKQGFENYLKDNPEIKAVIVGNRRTDPFSHDLQPFHKTDNDWPEFVRVHPILDWTYQEIWFFLVSLGLDYCELYDAGYTSIGGISSTIENPYLKKDEYEKLNHPLDMDRVKWYSKVRGQGLGEYYPAYFLQNDSYERFSRTTKH